MATNIKLSKIQKVDLRDCWDDEAKDFTPWLATEENIALLADTLGMNELEVKAQEEHVGRCPLPGNTLALQVSQ